MALLSYAAETEHDDDLFGVWLYYRQDRSVGSLSKKRWSVQGLFSKKFSKNIYHH